MTGLVGKLPFELSQIGQCLFEPVAVHQDCRLTG